MCSSFYVVFAVSGLLNFVISAQLYFDFLATCVGLFSIAGGVVSRLRVVDSASLPRLAFGYGWSTLWCPTLHPHLRLSSWSYGKHLLSAVQRDSYSSSLLYVLNIHFLLAPVDFLFEPGLHMFCHGAFSAPCSCRLVSAYFTPSHSKCQLPL